MVAFYLNLVNNTVILCFNNRVNWMQSILVSEKPRLGSILKCRNGVVLWCKKSSISLSYWAILWLITVMYFWIHNQHDGKMLFQCYSNVTLIRVAFLYSWMLKQKVYWGIKETYYSIIHVNIKLCVKYGKEIIIP